MGNLDQKILFISLCILHLCTLCEGRTLRYATLTPPHCLSDQLRPPSLLACCKFITSFRIYTNVWPTPPSHQHSVFLQGKSNVCLVLPWTVNGRWVRCSSCTTSGSASRCRSVGSGCRPSSGASTPPRPGPAAGRPAGRGGGGCAPRSCPTWATWHRRRSSTPWASWKNSSRGSSHDRGFFLWPWTAAATSPTSFFLKRF